MKPFCHKAFIKSGASEMLITQPKIWLTKYNWKLRANFLLLLPLNSGQNLARRIILSTRYRVF